MKKIIMYIAIFLLIISCNKVFAASEEEMEEMRNAVLEIIQAYHRKGVSIQYDSYRRNTHFSPEDATSQGYVYTVCSGYPNMVFYQAFGVYVSPYSNYITNNALRYKDNTEVVPFFINGSDLVYSVDGIGASEEDIDEVIDRLKPIIKVGDIFAVSQANGDGHAMLFGELDQNGEPYIYESTGHRYNISNHTENFEVNGSLKKVTFRSILLRYVRANHNLNRVAIVRFINSNNEYINRAYDAEIKSYSGLTDSAKSRLKYPGIDITKTSNIINENGNNTRNSVTPGDIIEYKIEIKNNSSENYENLIVSETLDENVELIDSQNHNLVNNNKIWNIPSIPAGTVKVITYKVKVNDNANILGKYIVSTGYVDKIKNRTINLYVTESLTTNEQNKLLNEYETLKTTSSKNDIDFLIDLYRQSLNIDISFMSGKTFKNYVTHNGCTDSKCKVYLSDETVKSITLGNYYNIRLGTATLNDDGNVDDEESIINDIEIKAMYGWYIYNVDDLTTRPRELLLSDFEIGDILITRRETNGEMLDKAYIYLGNGILARRHNQVLEYGNGNTTMQEILNNLNEDNYIVLRPAILIDRKRIDSNNNNNEKVSDEPQIVEVANTLKTINIIFIITSITLLISGIIIILKYKLIQHK